MRLQSGVDKTWSFILSTQGTGEYSYQEPTVRRIGRALVRSASGSRVPNLQGFKAFLNALCARTRSPPTIGVGIQRTHSNTARNLSSEGLDDTLLHTESRMGMSSWDLSRCFLTSKAKFQESRRKMERYKMSKRGTGAAIDDRIGRNLVIKGAPLVIRRA